MARRAGPNLGNLHQLEQLTWTRCPAEPRRTLLDQRYSQRGRKTGTAYPDVSDRDKQLFEFMLIVKLDRDWSLQVIYEFDCNSFCKRRSWDKRMNAWYIGLRKNAKQSG